jgi:hypothetical protein
MATFPEPLDDSDFDLIQPRPEPKPQPLPDPTPEPMQKAEQIAQAAILPRKYLRPLPPEPDAKCDGPTQEEILLSALTIVARKEPQTVATRGAMRDLIRRHSIECGLGF